MTSLATAPYNWDAFGASIADKVTVVAGGARGTGKSTVARLLSMGARVAVIDLNAEGLTALRGEFAEHGDRRTVAPADCTDPHAVQAACDEVRAQREAGLIHRQTHHHLPGKGDHGDVLGPISRGGEQLPCGIRHGAPPVRRVLFRPAGPRVGRGVRAKGARHGVSLQVEQRGLVPRRAQVMGQDELC